MLSFSGIFENNNIENEMRPFTIFEIKKILYLFQFQVKRQLKASSDSQYSEYSPFSSPRGRLVKPSGSGDENGQRRDQPVNSLSVWGQNSKKNIKGLFTGYVGTGSNCPCLVSACLMGS